MKFTILFGKRDEFVECTRDRGHIKDLILEHFKREGYKSTPEFNHIITDTSWNAEALLETDCKCEARLCDLFEQTREDEIGDWTYEDLIYSGYAPEIEEDYDLIEASNFEIYKGCQTRYGESNYYHIVVEVTEEKEVNRIRRKLIRNYEDRQLPPDDDEGDED